MHLALAGTRFMCQYYYYSYLSLLLLLLRVALLLLLFLSLTLLSLLITIVTVGAMWLFGTCASSTSAWHATSGSPSSCLASCGLPEPAS